MLECAEMKRHLKAVEADQRGLEEKLHHADGGVAIRNENTALQVGSYAYRATIGHIACALTTELQ